MQSDSSGYERTQNSIYPSVIDQSPRTISVNKVCNMLQCRRVIIVIACLKKLAFAFSSTRMCFVAKRYYSKSV